jgi:hypothetical protein
MGADKSPMLSVDQFFKYGERWSVMRERSVTAACTSTDVSKSKFTDPIAD